MKNYSIVRVGSEYVVQADEKSILKISSRRRAAKLITVAAELLDQEPLPADEDDDLSIARDPDAETEPFQVP